VAVQFACEPLVTIEDLACECDLPDDEDTIDAVLDGASDLLTLLAGVQLGRCTEIYRPCRQDHCSRPACCGCCNLKGIHLPGLNPTVEEVKIDGVIVDESEYVVMTTPTGVAVLERVDAYFHSIWWPTCQSLLAPSTADNTFQITVESGQEINMAVTLAAAEIACDIFKALAGEEHALPQGTVSASMHGVTVDFRRFGNPTDPSTMELVGMPWTERFLSSMPTVRGTQIISPETWDGWDLYQRA